MLPWGQRPFEVANLFNPAFCSVLLEEAIANFEEKAHKGMPYALVFIILPIVLHKPTRDLLPRSTRTRLSVWLQRSTQVRIGFAERARRLVPYTKEALIFGMSHGAIDVDTDGNLICASNTKNLWERGTETYSCQNKSGLLGRWFALSGEARTIFTMWGVRP
jgi:hypothetical protein